MEKLLEIIKNKIILPNGCNCNLEKVYRVLIIKNGEKKAVYEFDNEEEATHCYALICNPNINNEDFIMQEEVFLTIHYKQDIWC